MSRIESDIFTPGHRSGDHVYGDGEFEIVLFARRLISVQTTPIVPREGDLEVIRQDFWVNTKNMYEPMPENITSFDAHKKKKAQESLRRLNQQL